MTIDLWPEQAAIRAAYGHDWHRSPDALRELSALWGASIDGDTNDCGVFHEGVKETLAQAGRSRAQVVIRQAPNGLWAMSTGYDSATRGASAPISVWNRYAYLSRDDARRAGALKLIEDFREIENATDSVTSESEKRAARQVIAQLEKVLTPQLSLF
jgi:hypothetical protein